MINLLESIFNVGYLITCLVLLINLSLKRKKQLTLFIGGFFVMLLKDAVFLTAKLVASLSPDGFNLFQQSIFSNFSISGLISIGLYFLIYLFLKLKTTIKLNKINIYMLINVVISLLIMFLAIKIPALSYLNIVKNLFNLMIIYEIYQSQKLEFKAITFFDLSISFLITGLISGVFYREFTKFYHFKNSTHLGKLHPHTLILGFIFFLLVYLIVRNYDQEALAILKTSVRVYVSGLILTITMMMIYGVYDVVGQNQKLVSVGALEGFSGIGHILISIGILMILLKIKNNE